MAASRPCLLDDPAGHVAGGLEELLGLGAGGGGAAHGEDLGTGLADGALDVGQGHVGLDAGLEPIGAAAGAGAGAAGAAAGAGTGAAGAAAPATSSTSTAYTVPFTVMLYFFIFVYSSFPDKSFT